MNIYFKNITINKIIREGKSGCRPLLTILFDYERIKMEYLNTPTGKGPAARSEASWNLKANTGDFEDPIYEEYEPRKNNNVNMADLQLASVMAGVLAPQKNSEHENKTKPFKIQFQEDFLPLANISFVANADGEIIKGSTDGKGFIDIEIPKSCSKIKVKISDNKPLNIEILEEAPTGNKAIQQRLVNYGLYDGAIDGEIGEKTEMAILIFQIMMNEVDNEDLKLDGNPGPITEEKMKERPGF